MSAVVQRKPSKALRILRAVGFAFYVVIAVAIGLEVALRLFPSAIPLTLLRAFDDSLRVEIAERVGLQTRQTLRELPRDDGGPPLYIYLPYSEVSPPGKSVKVVMDGRGFCNPEPLEGPPFDVITVGGSIAACQTLQPAETWTALLGKTSGRRSYNLSVPGTGPYEYLQVLKQIGLSFSPKFVLFNVSEENDMRDVIKYQNMNTGAVDTLLEGDQQTVLHTHSAGGVLARNSYLFGVVRAALIARQEDRAKQFKEPAFPGLPDQETINYRFVARWDDRVLAFNQDNSSKGQPLFAMALQRGLIDLEGFKPVFEELRRLSALNRFTPIVVYTPTTGSAYAKYVEYEDGALATVMQESSRLQREYLAAAARDAGLMFVDLTPGFQAAVDALKGDEVLYNIDDLHPTSAGHRVTAEILAERLRDVLSSDEASTD